MNWGSGQEPIIGRNEFLSQPSQEACGPGETALTRVSGKDGVSDEFSASEFKLQGPDGFR